VVSSWRPQKNAEWHTFGDPNNTIIQVLKNQNRAPATQMCVGTLWLRNNRLDNWFFLQIFAWNYLFLICFKLALKRSCFLVLWRLLQTFLIYMSQAFAEIRHFRKCLGNWGNLWFFKNNSILGNRTPLKS
jgi:hypothetical protein